MKTFTYLLRTPTVDESRFRASAYDAAIAQLRPNDMLLVNPNLYLCEYEIARTLSPYAVSKLSEWCAKLGITNEEKEKMFLHRPDGTWALAAYNGYCLMNLGNNNFREWSVEAARRIISGRWYGGTGWPDGVVRALLVDVAVWWADFDEDGVSTNTIEYLNRGLAYEKDSMEISIVLQNRIPEVDIIPNMSTAWYCLKPQAAPILDACHGFMMECGVDFSKTGAALDKQIAQVKSVIGNYPNKKKFVGLYNATNNEEEASIAAWITDENTLFAHRSNGAINWRDAREIWMWMYNPLLLQT